MKTQFTFNSKTSPYATTDVEFNQMFIRRQENFFNDVLKVRGYIYLNTIYEMLGIKWDPDWNNLCLRYEPYEAKLRFAVRAVNEDGFDIDIL